MQSAKTPTEQGFHRWTTTTLAAVSLLLALASLGGSVTAIMIGESGESGYTPGSLPYPQIIALTSLFLVPLILAPHSNWSTAYGSRLPTRPWLPRTLTATGFTWLAMGTTGVANPWINTWLGNDQWTGVSASQEITDPEMRILAITTGITEEAAHLAIPAGLTYLTGSAINAYRTHHGRTPIPHRTLWLTTILTTMTFGALTRFAGHLYQGTTSAALAVVWAVALAAVFFWVRSVWPVMLGHTLYNWPAHHVTWTDMISHHMMTPALFVLGGLAWLWFTRTRAVEQAPRHQNARSG